MNFFQNKFINVEFRFGDLTDVNILQKIKLRIKEELENEHYIFYLTPNLF